MSAPGDGLVLDLPSEFTVSSAPALGPRAAWLEAHPCTGTGRSAAISGCRDGQHHRVGDRSFAVSAAFISCRVDTFGTECESTQRRFFAQL